MYYGANLLVLQRRLAYFVNKILKGAKPAEIPVEQPTKFELIINLKTAKQIGVIIPQSVHYRRIGSLSEPISVVCCSASSRFQDLLCYNFARTK